MNVYKKESRVGLQSDRVYCELAHTVHTLTIDHLGYTYYDTF